MMDPAVAQNLFAVSGLGVRYNVCMLWMRIK
jgi:hypothetical protein